MQDLVKFRSKSHVESMKIKFYVINDIAKQTSILISGQLQNLFLYTQRFFQKKIRYARKKYSQFSQFEYTLYDYIFYINYILKQQKVNTKKIYFHHWPDRI